MSCIFCRIAKKEIPAHCIYEDDDFFAFLDISPVSRGHTLLIPKNHSNNILETDDSILSKMLIVSKSLGNKLVSSLNAKGLNILINTNEVAGQTCFHTHMHLIPRYDDLDGFKLEFTDDKHPKMSFEEIINLVKISK